MGDPLNSILKGVKAVKAPRGMSTRIVAIDGPGGAGKSSLAEQLSPLLDNAPIIHTDDFSGWDNPLGWWPRMLEQVLLPLASNKSFRYQRYDWRLNRLAEWHEVAPAEYMILEGVSSGRREFRSYLSFVVWVETPRDERLRRGLERDGEDARGQWEKWMVAEDEYIERERPRESADLIVSGA